MTFVHKAAGIPASVAVFAGAFNPPTAAHVALAEAALEVVDEVLYLVPRHFPHKEFHGATLDQRLQMLNRIAQTHSRWSAGVAEGGLIAEMARDAKPHYPGAQIYLLCGRDAAERILTWKYDEVDFVDKMLEEFRLLIAPRAGEFCVEERFGGVVRLLTPTASYEDCSSTKVREALATGNDWKALSPDVIADLIEEIYRR